MDDGVRLGGQQLRLTAQRLHMDRHRQVERTAAVEGEHGYLLTAGRRRRRRQSRRRRLPVHGGRRRPAAPLRARLVTHVRREALLHARLELVHEARAILRAAAAAAARRVHPLRLARFLRNSRGVSVRARYTYPFMLVYKKCSPNTLSPDNYDKGLILQYNATSALNMALILFVIGT